MTLGNHSDIASTGSNITANITVGNYTTVGPHVQMHTLHQHACVGDRSLVSTFPMRFPGYPHTFSEEKLIIGSDVWIGRNATLLGNITIGDGAIIGAFAVVAKDIPPYAVIVGNPAKITRYRFDEETIAKLLQIQWWNWSDEQILERQNDFRDIDTFVKKWYTKHEDY